MIFKTLFFFLLFINLVQAQTPHIEHITIEQGLSQGFVPSITQDDEGFLWFATKNGLNRYDGYHFKVFRYDPFDDFSLNNDEIVTVKSAGDFLFLVTSAENPMLFHRKTNRFFEIGKISRLHDSNEMYFSPSGNDICIYFKDQDGITHMQYFTWPTNSDSIVKEVGPHWNIDDLITMQDISLPKNMQFLVNSANKQNLWFLAQNQLVKQEIATGKNNYIDLPTDKLSDYREKLKNVLTIVEYQGSTWIFGLNAILLHDENGWHDFQYVIKPIKFNHFDPVKGIYWYAVNDHVYGLDLTMPSFDAQPLWTLPVEKQIRSLYVDKTSNLWIGTDAFGVRKFNPRSGIFKNYLAGYSIKSKPLFDGEKYILVSDVLKGVGFTLLIDRETAAITNISLSVKLSYIGSSIAATLNGDFWWTEASFDRSKVELVKVDPETLHREAYRIPDELNQNVLALWVNPGKEKIWILSTSAIAIFDLKTETYDVSQISEETYEVPYAVERDRNGNFWIGTEKGLIKLELLPDGNWSFSRMTAEKGNRNSLPENFIKSLLFDPADSNILWIGTNGRGLSRYDTRTGKFEHFNQAGGILPDDVVYGILADDENPRNLWLSTNRGLSRFNPEAGIVQHFTRSDGLQENEFNTFAYAKTSDGLLLFGGVNGLTAFDPADIANESNPPSIKFTSLAINGNTVNPRDSVPVISQDISFTNQVVLDHTQNNVELHFAALDFTVSNRNQYSYYLEGAEIPWVHKGFNNSVQYLNLSPGRYTFWLKAANSSGAWNNEALKLQITIRPPWYLSWPAYIVYLLLFILAGYLFNQYQLQQRLKTADARRLKNLDEFKNRFFTNITHEFRTPLTVILGMSRRLTAEQPSLMQPLTLISRNGENLLRLINQILDLAKLESNNLKFNFVQGDVLAYLRYISESLHSLANAQNVMLLVKSDQSKIMMDYDPERLRQIAHNLLSNAIKFTPSGGKVIMQVNLKGRNLEIAVMDTGIGIPEAALPRLFDRFFQVDDLATDAQLQKKSESGGTGIGLSLTHELVLAMGGTITVASPRPDGKRGTVFIVTLPVSNNAILNETTTSDEKTTTAAVEHQKAFLSNAEAEHTILLVEDNPDVTEYLAACLGSRYRLEFAFNGRSGIENAVEIIPDLIISDVMMPEKDGFEVCDFLKNDERTSHIPIILLTAKANVESRIAGLRRGADAYLAKPFHEEELMVWVEQLVARQQLLRMRYANLQVNLVKDISVPAVNELVIEDAFVQKFKNLLEENYSDSELSVDIICTKMGMSRAQIYRKLNALTGKTVTSHLNAVRLAKAKELLMAGELNVSEIAYEVGYNDPKYFSRLFSESYGRPPVDLR